jgi:hypothetical protein
MRFRPEIDYYEVLQVHPRAAAEMIRKAYRTLMGEMRGHPDLGGDEDRAKLINEAYSVLSDPDIRCAYDQARARSTPRAAYPGGGPAVWPGSPAARGPYTGSGGELERWAVWVTKVLYSAIVVAAGMMIARLVKSPAIDLADMIATLFVLFRIWQQTAAR